MRLGMPTAGALAAVWGLYRLRLVLLPLLLGALHVAGSVAATAIPPDYSPICRFLGYNKGKAPGAPGVADTGAPLNYVAIAKGDLLG